MAAADILSIIKKYDIPNANQDDRVAFDRESNNWRRSCDDFPGPITLWYDVTKLLASKVCVSDIPSDGSEGVILAKRIIQLIQTQTGDSAYEPIEYDNLYGLFFDMILTFIELEPSVFHLILWVEIFGYKPFKEYYMNLPKEKINKMLKSLQKDIYFKGETNDDYKEYSTKLQPAILYIVQTCITPELLKRHHVDYLDLLMFYLTHFLNSKPVANSTMHSLGMKLYYILDRKPFKGITNPEIYRKHLNFMLGYLCDNAMPKDETTTNTMVSTLQYILTGIEEESLFGELYLDLMEFLTSLCNKTSGEPAYSAAKAIGAHWYLTKYDLKNKPFIFDAMAPMIAEFLENLKDPELCEVRLIKPALYNILGKVMNNSKEHCGIWIRILKAAVPFPGCADAVYNAVRDQEKFLKWKNHQKEAKEIFKLIYDINLTYTDSKKRRDTINNYKNFTTSFLDQLKKAKVLPDMFDDLANYSLTILEENKVDFYELAYKVADAYDGLVFKKHGALVMSSLKRVAKVLRCKHEWNIKRCCAVQEITNNSLAAITDFKSLESEDVDVLIDVCDAALSGDFITPDNQPGTEHYRIYVVAVFKTFKLMADSGDVSKAKHVVAKVINLLEHEEDEVVSMATNQIYVLSNGNGGPDCLAPHLPKLIEVYLNMENYMLLGTIQLVYPRNGAAIEEFFQKLFESFDSGERSIQNNILLLIAKVAEHQPKLFTKDNVDKIMEAMFAGDSNQQSRYLMIIDKLAEKRISIILHTLDELLAKEFNEVSFFHLYSILTKIAAKSDEKVAKRVMNRFIQVLSGPENPNHSMVVLGDIRFLVSTHKPVVEKHKSFIMNMKESSTNQAIRDICTSLIDLLEGRSLETIADDLEQQQEHIENIDVRVTTTENSVNTVTEEVERQKEDIQDIKTGVNEQGEKLDELGEVVEDVVKQVEEIDQKTLSHAPYWSRDVSKLLNIKSDHDWRLLSGRLGYSNADIRGWAQQSDPCMAMLNEWYATRKTSEASYGVLTTLQEMDRMDAAIIVENAMKAADQVVEDEEFAYVSPPRIFLSYQWGHQEEVKLLRHHLELAGYDCWLDIGQMGGGDKLFEKIDQGIRAAKIIISCTTEKYAKSPNCNREVNLSVTLNKPIIPILLEDCSWPPPGSMGPIFSEYLYIQFYQRNKEDETQDNRFWPIPKFQELLMQLSVNGIVPDASKVHKMYKNWWLPLVEEIKIDKSNTVSRNKKLEEIKPTDKEDEMCPDVFISYQWGKQKNIMLLYKRLTELGYRCWMDIHQMGGGDSLYDKIDRGIRGCQVVLSCLTEKYTLSVNCRREVSLCDALKRPIIPLLLENMSWPPRGPMSIAFTELLYIDLHSDSEVQKTWSGPKFEEIKSKLSDYLADPEKNKKLRSEFPKQPVSPPESSVTPATSSSEGARPPIKRDKASGGISSTPETTAPSSNKLQAEPCTETTEPTPKGSSSISPAYSGSRSQPPVIRPISSTSKNSKSCDIL